jgi:hypothetical protein
MTLKMIDEPPENHLDYVTAKPNDKEEQFVKDLVGLLRQHTFHIRADSILIDWAERAAKEAPADGYKVMMQQIPVNLDCRPSTAFGTFYFERHTVS